MECPHSFQAVMTDSQPELDADRALMEGVARREEPAVRAFITRFEQPVLRLGRRLLGDPAEAEDLCQEVLVTAVTRASSYEGVAPLRAWVFRVATNLGLNRLRRRRPDQLDRGFDRMDAAARDPSEVAEERETARTVRRAVEALPERQRMAVLLLRYEGLSYRDIAHALDTSLPAVESLIHRAHNTLRETLKKLRQERK